VNFFTLNRITIDRDQSQAQHGRLPENSEFAQRQTSAFYWQGFYQANQRAEPMRTLDHTDISKRYVVSPACMRAGNVV
jgi:hypothetical protein